MSNTAPLDECLEKLEEFERVETERTQVLNEQSFHANELKRIYDDQTEIEGRLAAKQGECESLVGQRDALAELIEPSDALAAAARATEINQRLQEIDARLREIRPQITGDGPFDATQTTNLINEASDLLAERDDLLTEHAEKMEIVSLYTAAVEEVEQFDADIQACEAEIAQIDSDARANHQAFEDRDIPYQISLQLATTKLNRLYDYQARLIAGNCDAHEEIEIPEVDDDPGTTFEDLLAPPEETEVDGTEESDFEEVEIDDAFESDVDIDLDGDDDGDEEDGDEVDEGDDEADDDEFDDGEDEGGDEEDDE